MRYWFFNVIITLTVCVFCRVPPYPFAETNGRVSARAIDLTQQHNISMTSSTSSSITTTVPVSPVSSSTQNNSEHLQEDGLADPILARLFQNLTDRKIWPFFIFVSALLVVIFILWWLNRETRQKRGSQHRNADSAAPGTRPLPTNIVLPGSSISPPAGAYLEYRQGEQVHHLELKIEGTTVGRAPENTLVVDETFQAWETVSAYHARIAYVDKTWRLEDLQSTNGVYINGQRTGRNVLRDGWELKLGGVIFVFRTSGDGV